MAQTGATVITVDNAQSRGADFCPLIIKLAWTATAGGAVVSDTDSTGYSLFRATGYLMAAVLTDTSATAAYDVVIRDARGLDILGGQGTDVAGASSTTTKILAKPSPVFGVLQLTIAAAGNATTGIIYLYIR